MCVAVEVLHPQMSFCVCAVILLLYYYWVSLDTELAELLLTLYYILCWLS